MTLVRRRRSPLHSTPTDAETSDSVVLVDRHRVAVRRFGSIGGWPLMWCHGGLSCALDAELLDAAAVRCGTDVIAIDRPGIGCSDEWDLPSVADWPRLVEHVADSLKLGDFAVAGWSAGGPYALACAAAMPSRVRVVATLAGMAPLETARQVFELGLWADRMLIYAARWSPRAAAVPLWLSRGAPDRYVAREVRRAAGSRDRSALHGPALQSVLAAMRGATARGVRGTVEDYRRFGGAWGFDLGAVRQPVTVWQGEHDVVLPVTHARRLASALPGGTLEVVAASGHFLPAVAADAVLSDLAPS